MKLSAADIVHADNMAARSTFKISDEVRDVLARSTITATSVKLPEGQLERKLYEQVNKALAGSGGRWDRKSGTHLFDRDPREALGIAVETGKATNVLVGEIDVLHVPSTVLGNGGPERVVDPAVTLQHINHGTRRRHERRGGSRQFSDQLLEWRTARAAAVALADAHAVERATIAAAVRVAYAAACTPAQRARLVPAPTAPCRFADLSHAYMSWRDVLGRSAKGKAAVVTADAAIVEHGARLAAMGDEQRAASDAEHEAASRITEPVSGEGASWHLVRSVSIYTYGSQGLGAASYARASATLRARDLIELGYRVRCIARRRPASLPVGPYYLGAIWAWDVYAWTCDEGERIAPHQAPPRSIADDLRRARDEGVNPAALWSCVPYRLVEAAGADRVSDRGPPPPLAWETLDADEPLPPLEGDANLLDVNQSRLIMA